MKCDDCVFFFDAECHRHGEDIIEPVLECSAYQKRDFYLRSLGVCGCDICKSDLTCIDCRDCTEKYGIYICMNPFHRNASLRYARCEYEVNSDTPACHMYKEENK